MKSNLEPIEESDMDLEGKLKKGASSIDLPQKENEQFFAVEKEISKEVSVGEKDDAYGKILSKMQKQQDDNSNADDIASDAAAVAKKVDAESQIQHLVDVAQQKGVVYAVNVARNMQDNYILDMFHDRLLAEELHDALLKKGLITEI